MFTEDFEHKSRFGSTARSGGSRRTFAPRSPQYRSTFASASEVDGAPREHACTTGAHGTESDDAGSTSQQRPRFRTSASR
jgi:hypothetical protein